MTNLEPIKSQQNDRRGVAKKCSGEIVTPVHELPDDI
jgi:hypothetical protein